MADKKKPTVVHGDDVPTPEVPQNAARPAGWNVSKIIWGLTLIALGALFLLETLNIVSLDIAALLRLWPLLIILAGLSVLALRGWVAVVVSIVATLVVIGLAALVLTGAVATPTDRHSEEFRIGQQGSRITEAEVSIKTGAASLNVAGGNGSDIAAGTLKSGIANLAQTTSTAGTTQKVELMTTANGARWWRGDGRTELDVRLTQKLPVDVRIDAGAANIRADLSDVRARFVRVESGASQVWVKLGTKQEVSDVSLSTGVSSVELLVPQDAGVEVRMEKGLSSAQLPDDVQRIDDTTYRSRAYDQRERRVMITVDMGVSSIRIVRY